jgi:hypothetical protein
LILDTDTYRLATGDSITFDGAVPHTWRIASTSSYARVIWILAPGLPDPLHYVKP